MLPGCRPLRGRFAPTPSGHLHLGNASTALLAWLQIRSQGGRMILRLEDLDQPRCKPEMADAILEELRWLELDWDEGPDVGGEDRPYLQSQRLARYEAALETLSQQDLLYPCYCSRADLLSAPNAPHGLAAEGPIYAGTCRHLSLTERRKREAGKMPSLRFKLPLEREFPFTDGIAGPVCYPAGHGGDFIVKRSDGIIAYQLAVVVDDIAMQVTDVLRGWDLLDSTARQLALYEALGSPPPQFAHAPLILGPDGSRLSKRHGSVTLSGLRSEYGASAQQVIGFLAWLMGITDRPEPGRPEDYLNSVQLNRIPRETVQLPKNWLLAMTNPSRMKEIER